MSRNLSLARRKPPFASAPSSHLLSPPFARLLCSSKTAGSSETLYERLGVDRSADEQTIRAGWRHKVRTTHPDVAGAGSKEVFERISEAYATLNDPAKKRAYDSTLGSSRPPPAPHFAGRTEPTQATPQVRTAEFSSRAMFRLKNSTREYDAAERERKRAERAVSVSDQSAGVGFGVLAVGAGLVAAAASMLV